MEARADLHLHTTASDGRWTPKELLAKVQQAGIELFAVTDHDSLGSLSEVAGLVQGSGHSFLPGVELSARLNDQVYHLLAYGFDPEDAGLIALVEANGAQLAGASDEVIHRLIEANYPLSWDEYAAYTWDRRRGGWKGLNFLIDHDYCLDAYSYFDDLIADMDLPQPEFVSTEQAIAVAQGAGGVVSLAHPGAGFYNGAGTGLLDVLVDQGLEGLECFSFHHDESMTRAYLDYCRSRDLLITGGSDCHGGFVGRSLGVPELYAADLKLGELEDRLLR